MGKKSKADQRHPKENNKCSLGVETSHLVRNRPPLSQIDIIRAIYKNSHFYHISAYTISAYTNFTSLGTEHMQNKLS